MKRALILFLAISMILPIAACRPEETVMTSETTETSETSADIYDYKYQRYAAMTPEEITAELTLEQKAAQMVQPILYNSKIKCMQDC